MYLANDRHLAEIVRADFQHRERIPASMTWHQHTTHKPGLCRTHAVSRASKAAIHMKAEGPARAPSLHAAVCSTPMDHLYGPSLDKERSGEAYHDKKHWFGHLTPSP
jgi:hypothetical protein